MARPIRTLMFFALIFVARPAFAGGACPSGANYTNPANPTGSLVTLASLGVTNGCYFVAANGSDSNSGTSEASPWLHAPMMPNCSGNCLTLQNTFTNQTAAGIGIILRGGDTWHLGNSSASPYTGGTWEFNQYPGAYVEGTASHPFYAGYDVSWFSGSSFARPILTEDNPLCNASTANGTTCISTTDSYGQPSFYVSSCAYQAGSSNNMIDLSSLQYIIIDGFEMTGLCLSQAGQIQGNNTYIRYGSAVAPIYLQNLYAHGSSHLRFQALNGHCTSGQVCTGIFVFQGSVNVGSVGETVVFNVADFSDSDPGGTNLCFGGFYNAAYNAFRYTTDCNPGTLHVFHDNLYEYFFETGHANLLEDISEVSGANAIYNNVFRHIETYVTSGGGVGLWQAPPTSGTTDYIFDNLMYDVGSFEYINVGGTAGNNALGNYTFFNNTFQTNNAQPILRCEGYTNGAVTDTNNHYIDDGTQYLGPCSTLVTKTPLLMSNSTATSDGYTSSQAYAYSPTSSSSPTVGVGTNEGTLNGAFCLALSTAANSDSTLSDAATACLSDTRYACTYNTSNHTVTCPARTAVTQPTSTAWDIGAYKSNGTQASAPNPPSNLAAVVQ